MIPIMSAGNELKTARGDGPRISLNKNAPTSCNASSIAKSNTPHLNTIFSLFTIYLYKAFCFHKSSVIYPSCCSSFLCSPNSSRSGIERLEPIGLSNQYGLRFAFFPFFTQVGLIGGGKFSG